MSAVDRVRVEADACVGAGTCVLTAPDVFDQDDDGVVVLLTDRVGPDRRGAVRDAVARCPARAIRVQGD